MIWSPNQAHLERGGGVMGSGKTCLLALFLIPSKPYAKSKLVKGSVLLKKTKSESNFISCGKSRETNSPTQISAPFFLKQGPGRKKKLCRERLGKHMELEVGNLSSHIAKDAPCLCVCRHGFSLLACSLWLCKL